MVESPPNADSRDLLTPDEFALVAGVVQRNNCEMTSETAERITSQALAYVATCATFPHLRLRPSRTVDEGWHALILCTVVYARLCRELGLFVHHAPEPPGPERHDPGALSRTMTAMRAAGYPVEPDLWVPPTDRTIPVAADCEHSEPPPAGCGFDCSNTGPN
ncbi:hypothetical protein UK12_27440 [Saccharothrix sp. ST-888]|nr:hypothetical protein UK12_27440 [Saccharothrix sp. ST-888]